MRTEEELLKEFAKPKEITDVQAAFPAGVMGGLLPYWKETPEEFRDDYNSWGKIAAKWFYMGLPKGTKLNTKEGVEPGKAIRHLSACLRSFEPKHEEKMAGVAFLMSLWFDSIEIPEED